MTTQIKNLKIRPEDGWVEAGDAPIVIEVRPSLKHTWYLAIAAAKPSNDTEDEQIFHGKKPWCSKELSGLLDGQKVWIRIKEPANSDTYSKMTFGIITGNA